MPSILYIVSTPIGNLGDVSLRALEVLREVDLIACEDTRITKKLLSRYGLSTPLTSYHEHNESRRGKELLGILQQGKDVALVSDAGTPGISDPGYRIVQSASQEGIRVVPVPGPSAAVAALSVSGFSTSGFTFLGFPPRSKKLIIELMQRVRRYPETLILYESPKRILRTLEAIYETLGDREISVSREITKLHEEIIRGRVSELIRTLSERGVIKGELTIIVRGASQDDIQCDSGAIEKLLTDLRDKGASLKESVEQAVWETGVSKSKIYKRALKIWD